MTEVSGLQASLLVDADRRTQALARLSVLDGVPPEALSRLTRLALFVAGGETTTISGAVHLLDDRFQHGVAGSGPTLGRTPVDESLCIRTLALDRPVFSADAAVDDRLTGTPWTAGEAPLRLYVGIPLRVRDGTAVGTLCLTDTRRHDLTAVQRDRLLDVADEIAGLLDLLSLTRELGHDAAHDPLTGIANRALLAQRLTQVLSRRDRPPGGPTLVLLDLDGFKQVNDRHGHAAGDEVLISTVRRLQALLRPEDLLARVGGDEFAVLVDEALDDAALARLLDRLGGATAEPHPTAAGPVRCGVSVGVARAGQDELAYELFVRADAQLYLRKSAHPDDGDGDGARVRPSAADVGRAEG